MAALSDRVADVVREKHDAHSPKTAAQFRYVVLPGNEARMFAECLRARPWWAPAEPRSKGGASRPAKGTREYSLWYASNGQRFDFSSLNGAATGKRFSVNRFANHRVICTKTGLAMTMASYARRLNLPSAERVGLPKTYIHAGADGRLGLEKVRKMAEQHAKAHSGESVWIVKPAALNRGFGIEVFHEVDTMLAFLTTKATAGSQWVVQKYIERPLLVHGRKFDIRQLVLVTPSMHVYMYRDSYVRTCAAKYEKDSKGDLSVHLTNDYLQKHLDSYGKFEDANKLDFDGLQAAIDAGVEAGANPPMSVRDDIWPGMCEAIAHVFAACLDQINKPHAAAPENVPPPTSDKQRRALFWELFGADFMVDLGGERPKVVLIEINTSPALFRHGAVLEDLMPRMIEEVVQLCIDPYFPPPPDHKSFDVGARLPKGRRFDKIDIPVAPSLPSRRSPSPFKSVALASKGTLPPIAASPKRAIFR